MHKVSSQSHIISLPHVRCAWQLMITVETYPHKKRNVLNFPGLVFSCRMFGFVARRTGSSTENVCHLFAEMDPEQPAVAIVNFINKVMLGPQLHRWESSVHPLWKEHSRSFRHDPLFPCCALLVFDHCARLCGCFREFSLDDLRIYGLNREQQLDETKDRPDWELCQMRLVKERILTDWIWFVLLWRRYMRYIKQ